MSKELIVISDGEEEESGDYYEVDEVRDRRTRRGKVQYLIHWKGYGSDDDTWEDESGLNCDELIRQFQARQKDHGVPKSIEGRYIIDDKKCYDVLFSKGFKITMTSQEVRKLCPKLLFDYLEKSLVKQMKKEARADENNEKESEEKTSKRIVYI